MRSWISPALALLIGALAASTALAERPAALAAELRDQHGRLHSLDAQGGEVAVVMVVTAGRLRNLRAWQTALQERFEDVRYVLIADVPADPPVTWEQVAEKLVRRVPDEVPILIDIDRKWAGELELDTGRPNVLVLGREGHLVARFRGREDEMLVQRVSAAIQRASGP